MRLQWVALDGFRSYRTLKWEPDSAVSLLVGANGAGKSNLMEAIGYLATMRSFRGAPDEALVPHDRESGVVRGEVWRDDVTTLVEVEIRRRGGRTTLVNKGRLARAADLLDHARIVTFLPEDLDIIKRGPDRRRAFLDDVAVQLSPAAHSDQAEFDRSLRQRNAFLKQRVDDEPTLAVWDQRLAQAGGKVMMRRARATLDLAPVLLGAYRDIAGADGDDGALRVNYASAWGGSLDARVSASEFASRLVEALAGARRADRERGITTIGPHRDDPVIELDGHDLRHHGSQGEQRTAALSLRLATHRAVTERIGVSPILLLDDVFSELDPDRAGRLASVLPAGQTVITTADRGDVPVDGRVWTVAGGAVT
jgi:DNA replication and repair protein RecF